jgi:hypothetical protein
MGFAPDGCYRSLQFIGSATLLQPRTIRAANLLMAISLSLGIANAQCPAAGADTTCGAIITVTDAGASILYTGQGPYDGFDDTLVGVVNNSTLPITSINLTSSFMAFAFDGDGIDTYGVPGNGQDTTGYGGPNAYFNNISTDLTMGTVNFIVPIAPHGGTSFFSLEAALSAATACSTIINNSVTNSAGTGTQTTMTATFTPNLGYTLAQAAQLCGFTAWDWQSTVTSMPAPSPFYAVAQPVPVSPACPTSVTSCNLVTPPTFNDPPPNGYSYETPPDAVVLPVFWNLFLPASNSNSLGYHETSTTLEFVDSPADQCLPGGKDLTPCGGVTAPAGSQVGKTTHLVGIVGNLPGATVLDTGIGFSWTDSFNGTAGGISVLYNPGGVDPGSGTGGSTVTNVNPTTTYQYPPGLVVVAVNGQPVSPPPAPTLLNQIKVTSSGLAYSRVTKTFNGTVVITNIGTIAIPGPIQVVMNSLTPGVTLVNATSTFGGFPFVTVPGVNSLTSGQSVTVSIQFKNQTAAAIHFVPLAYSGSFN